MLELTGIWDIRERTWSYLEWQPHCSGLRHRVEDWALERVIFQEMECGLFALCIRENGVLPPTVFGIPNCARVASGVLRR